MTQEIVNVICMKWGTSYGAHDVNVLHSMVKRHLKRPHRFVCLTDNKEGIIDEVECFDMPDIYVPQDKDGSPWRKLGMFSERIADLKGRSMFLDLDIVIIEDIDCFFSFSDKFSIIENWTQKGRGIGNSSVYCFNIGEHAHVIQYYRKNIEEVTNKYSNEQIYLSRKIGDIQYWPESWCRSFKKDCIPSYIIRYFKTPAKPKDIKIIAFHGKPKPQDVIKGGFYGNIFKYCRPTKWIEDNWR